MFDYAYKYREDISLFKLNKSLTNLRNYSWPFKIEAKRQVGNKPKAKSRFPRKPRREPMKTDKIKCPTHTLLYFHNV